MSNQPDHELEELEDDSRVPPRPEEALADVERAEQPATHTPPRPRPPAATPDAPSTGPADPAAR